MQGVGESSAMGAGARVQRDPLPACVRGTAAAGQGSAGRLLHAAEPAGFRSAGLALAPRGRGCWPRRAPRLPPPPAACAEPPEPGAGGDSGGAQPSGAAATPGAEVGTVPGWPRRAGSIAEGGGRPPGV